MLGRETPAGSELEAGELGHFNGRLSQRAAYERLTGKDSSCALPRGATITAFVYYNGLSDDTGTLLPALLTHGHSILGAGKQKREPI